MSGTDCIVLEGPATIRNVEELHAILAAALDYSGSVTVDCAGITDADLSLIQLLLAARKSARRSGQTLVLSAPADGALREALLQGGFMPVDDDEAGSDEQAFWLKGKNAR